MAAIEAERLRKAFGTVRAVDGVDLAVQQGEVFALLGPNGAGKTTTVEMLEGYLTPDSGRISVLGFEPTRGGGPYRDRIGIVLQQSGVERELTVKELLDRLGRLYSTPRDTSTVIETVGLVEKANSRIKTLSGGQRRRLDLAAALVGSPDLVFLDEPTTGFDPEARREAWKIIEGLAAEGTTVFLTTHYLDEAQRLANRVAVMTRGRIVALGDPSTLGGRDTATATIRFRVDGGPEIPAGLGAMPTGGGFVIATDDPTRALHDLTGWALRQGVELMGLEVTRPTLEDAYLDLVGSEG